MDLNTSFINAKQRCAILKNKFSLNKVLASVMYKTKPMINPMIITKKDAIPTI